MSVVKSGSVPNIFVVVSKSNSSSDNRGLGPVGSSISGGLYQI